MSLCGARSTETGVSRDPSDKHKRTRACPLSFRAETLYYASSGRSFTLRHAFVPLLISGATLSQRSAHTYTHTYTHTHVRTHARTQHTAITPPKKNRCVYASTLSPRPRCPSAASWVDAPTQAVRRPCPFSPGARSEAHEDKIWASMSLIGNQSFAVA